MGFSAISSCLIKVKRKTHLHSASEGIFIMHALKQNHVSLSFIFLLKDVLNEMKTVGNVTRSECKAFFGFLRIKKGRLKLFCLKFVHYVRPSFTVSRLSRSEEFFLVQPVYQGIECSSQLAATIMNDSFKHGDYGDNSS